MTEEGAGQVGLVMETADNNFEQELIEQMESNDEENSDSSEGDGDGSNSDSDGENGSFDEESKGKASAENTETSGESEVVLDSEDKDGSEGASSTESSDVAAISTSLDDVTGESAGPSTASTSEAAESSSSASSGMSSAGEASSEASSIDDEEDIEYIEEYSITATLVDEFGEEIDPDKYTEIDLPEFEDELLLDDTDNPPYDDVKVKTGLFKTAVYSYVEATVDNTIIKGLKKETVEGYVKGSESDEVSDSAASLVLSDEDDEPELSLVTVYSYTTDGENYTAFDEDSVVKFVYSLGTQTEFAYEDSDLGLKISAKLQIPGAIPDDAELVVTQITNDTDGYNYEAYMDALNDNADSIADDAGLDEANTYTDSNTLMYDIAFMYEGEEVQPAEGAVSVSIEFTNNQLTSDLAVSSEKDITVVHLPIKAQVKEDSEITSTVEATGITSDDIEVKTLTEATAEVSDAEKIEFSEDNFSIYAVTVYQSHEAGTDTFKTVLGDAVNFGITAGTFSLGGDSQTNFAAAYVSNASSQTGNNLTNEAEQTFMIGSIASGYTLNYRGGSYPAYFLIPSEYKSQLNNSGNSSTYFKVDTSYTSDEIQEDVYDMLEYAKDASSELASRTDNASLLYNSSTQKYYVDLTGYTDGTYYITMTADDMASIAQSDKLQIYKNEGQTIVFNVTSSRTINMCKYSVNGISDAMLSNNAYSTVAQTVIWNFTKATSINATGSLVGTFIAPTSVWNNYATCAGWLVAKTAYVYGGEWHNIYTGIKQISGTALFEAYKTIDGSYATVSGFEFTLYKQDTSAADGWSEIETVVNDGHNVTFSSIVYNESNTSIAAVGDSQELVYKIAETNGAEDSSGNAYIADKTVYYAKVTVTLNNNGADYYTVSEPSYYTDEECTVAISDSDRPVFDNTTGNGSANFKLYKYLNGRDPGDNKYTFTVRVLKTDGTLYTLTDSLTNDGNEISYTFDYGSSYIVNDRIYLVVTENDIINDSTSSVEITKDTDYIVVRIDNPGTDSQEARYYKVSADNIYAQRLEDASWSNKTVYMDSIAKGSTYYISDQTKAAFYNTGTGNLRIHKMVVNDYGSDFVRNNTKTALLSNVVFRITDNSSGNYIVFTGFTDASEHENWAVEYDASHNATGNTYNVYYNNNAQWMVEELPAGTYTVDEVADGLTFTYDADSNTSTVTEGNNLSRVTKYALTEDEEDTGSTFGGTGGENWRVVYSTDLDDHDNQGPSNVKVGSTDVDNASHTQTVQVCNYYSIPIGPIQVTKNFSGGTWTEDMDFTFKLEAIGYSAYTTEGDDVTLSSQPMPIDGSTVTINRDSTEVVDIDDDGNYVYGNVVTENEDGTYTAIAKFGAIPFRYKGTYYYKITEVDTGIDGVKYDSAVYYVKIVVSEKYTTFTKEYTYAKNKHSIYVQDGNTSDLNEKEDFYYLGADITYSDDSAFSNILAECELYLGEEPDTVSLANNEFMVSYSVGSAANVVFNNSLTGNLTVTKTWLTAAGADDSANYTSLTLYIWQRSEGSSDWTVYGDAIVLTPGTGWTATVTGLPLIDSSGNKYQYCVKESDTFMGTYSVCYEYGGSKYYADKTESITVGGENCHDTGYVMEVGSDGKNYGTVNITNVRLVINTLPSTGGSGTMPYTAAGLILVMISLFGYMLWFLCRRHLNRCDKYRI